MRGEGENNNVKVCSRSDGARGVRVLRECCTESREEEEEEESVGEEKRHQAAAAAAAPVRHNFVFKSSAEIIGRIRR